MKARHSTLAMINLFRAFLSIPPSRSVWQCKSGKKKENKLQSNVIFLKFLKIIFNYAISRGVSLNWLKNSIYNSAPFLGELLNKRKKMQNSASNVLNFFNFSQKFLRLVYSRSCIYFFYFHHFSKIKKKKKKRKCIN